jgi:hypothetical protein
MINESADSGSIKYIIEEGIIKKVEISFTINKDNEPIGVIMPFIVENIYEKYNNAIIGYYSHNDTSLVIIYPQSKSKSINIVCESKEQIAGAIKIKKNLKTSKLIIPIITDRDIINFINSYPNLNIITNFENVFIRIGENYVVNVNGNKILCDEARDILLKHDNNSYYNVEYFGDYNDSGTQNTIFLFLSLIPTVVLFGATASKWDLGKKIAMGIDVLISVILIIVNWIYAYLDVIEKSIAFTSSIIIAITWILFVVWVKGEKIEEFFRKISKRNEKETENKL